MVDKKKIPLSRAGTVSSIRDYNGISLVQQDAFPVLTEERAIVWLEEDPVILIDTDGPPVGLISEVDSGLLAPTSATQSVIVTNVVAGTIDPSDPNSPANAKLENQSSGIGPMSATQSVIVTNVVAGTIDPSDPNSPANAKLENQSSGIGPMSATQSVIVTNVVAGTIKPFPVIDNKSAAVLVPLDLGTSQTVNITNTYEYATPIRHQLSFEMPYEELVQRFTKDVIDTTLIADPGTAYLALAIEKPVQWLTTANLYHDIGSGFVDNGGIGFCTTGTLKNDIDELQTTLNITGISGIAPNTWFQIGSEIMELVSNNSGELTVKRGVLDTIPSKHSKDSLLYFWDTVDSPDTVVATSGDVVKLRAVTSSSVESIDVATASEQIVGVKGRAARPYPPSNLKINNEYNPLVLNGDISLTWGTRNRLTQANGSLVGYYEPNVTPEPDTTYSVTATDENGVVIEAVTGLVDTNYGLTNISEKELSGITSSQRTGSLRKVGDVYTGDPHWDNVDALLHFNDNLNDEKGRVWAASNTTYTDTSFLGKGVRLTGSTSLMPKTEEVNFDPRDEDFTIEFWYMPTAVPNAYPGIISKRANNSHQTFSFYVNQSGNNFAFVVRSTAGVNHTIFSKTQVTLDEGYSITGTRVGDTINLFINGKLETSQVLPPGTVLATVATGIIIGNLQWSGSYVAHGYFDELRITTGVARYYNNYTPATTQFPDMAGEFTSLDTLPSRLANPLNLELCSVRDGLDSYYKHNVSIARYGYSYKYKDLYKA